MGSIAEDQVWEKIQNVFTHTIIYVVEMVNVGEGWHGAPCIMIMNMTWIQMHCRHDDDRIRCEINDLISARFILEQISPVFAFLSFSRVRM